MNQEMNVTNTIDKPQDTRLLEKIKYYDFTRRTITQLPCGNGKELLALMSLGAEKAIGFDRSGEKVKEANQLAKDAGMKANFICTDILHIGTEYNKIFDFVYISAGSLEQYEDLNTYFEVAGRILKRGGKLVLHEIHPYAYLSGAKECENVHNISEIVTGLLEHDIRIKTFAEYEETIGGVEAKSTGKNVPMSYLIVAEKA